MAHFNVYILFFIKIYMRDLGSASGSFVNNKRLSQPSQESNPVEVHPDDTIQLGSNYTDDESALNKDRKKPSSPAIPHSPFFFSFAAYF